MENKIVSVIVGSVRMGRMGDKVANAIKMHMEKKGYKINLIDPLQVSELQTLKIPNQYNPNPSEEMKKVSSMLLESDGFILVTPEYNHSYSGTIKNVLDNFMPEYARKPFGIVSYSAGLFGGIRANEMLRPIVSELNGVATPVPFMVSGVNDAFDEKGEFKDKTYYERMNEFLKDFDWYLIALKEARKTSQ